MDGAIWRILTISITTAGLTYFTNMKCSTSMTSQITSIIDTRHLQHRHRRWQRGEGAVAPPKKLGKISLRQITCNIQEFCYFLCKYRVKFGHFINFSYIYFRAKMSCSPKLIELLCLCSLTNMFDVSAIIVCHRLC